MKKYIVLIMLAFFNSCFYGQEIGLVLAGGGGKGAYQVGVWKALEEYGLSRKVTVISGSSVGGLNGALFSCVTSDQAVKLWSEIVPNELQTDRELISQEGLLRVLNQISLSSLKKSNSFPKVYVTAVRARNAVLKILTSWIFEPGVNAHTFLLNDETESFEIKQKLLATSAFPIATKKIKLSDGYYYVDGGDEMRGGDNVPVSPVIKEYEGLADFIIVVYLSSNPKRITGRTEVVHSKYSNNKILEIAPSEDPGGLFEGTLNFKRHKIEYLIELGYRDTVKILSQAGLYPVSEFWFD